MLWWGGMTIVSVINIGAFLRVRTKEKDASKTDYQLLLQRLAGIYVFICAFRAMLPRIDVERVCFWDSWLSSVIVGRSVATIAELAFAAQICICVASLAGDLAKEKVDLKGITRAIQICAKLCFGLIILAEICSWTGVLTTVQIWNASEESLWMIVATLLTLCCAVLYTKMDKQEREFKVMNSRSLREKQEYQAAMHSARGFLLGILILAPIYIAFMVSVDIPMYYSRWQASGGQLPGLPSMESLMQGFLNGCNVVTHEYEAWKEDMVWMAGYFSAAVWGSIWIGAHPPRLPTK